jgi:membrane protein
MPATPDGRETRAAAAARPRPERAPVGGSRLLARPHRWADAVSSRCSSWAERQDPASASGVAVAAWRRYRAIDGPLESALLALYILVAIVPALLVIQEYLESDPTALADHLVRHYNLSNTTGELVRSVLVRTRTHELGSALFAIAGALFFGLGFGRVLQLVHVRAWRIALPPHGSDYARYAAVLLGLYGLILLLLLQLNQLAGGVAWVRLALAPGWVAVLTLYFTWAPRLLTHGVLGWRELVPSAMLTAVALVAVMVLSSLVMQLWVDLYARDYGGFGVVMAIFFWLSLTSAIVVGAASLAPSLAERRGLRRAAAAPAP